MAGKKKGKKVPKKKVRNLAAILGKPSFSQEEASAAMAGWAPETAEILPEYQNQVRSTDPPRRRKTR